MPCPTCSHTMQRLFAHEDEAFKRYVWWCPRCGTLREEISNPTGCQTNDESPRLVARCLALAEIVPKKVHDDMVREGIIEAIAWPENR